MFCTLNTTGHIKRTYFAHITKRCFSLKWRKKSVFWIYSTKLVSNPSCSYFRRCVLIGLCASSLSNWPNNSTASVIIPTVFKPIHITYFLPTRTAATEKTVFVLTFSLYWCFSCTHFQLIWKVTFTFNMNKAAYF